MSPQDLFLLDFRASVSVLIAAWDREATRLSRAKVFKFPQDNFLF